MKQNKNKNNYIVNYYPIHSNNIVKKFANMKVKSNQWRNQNFYFGGAETKLSHLFTIQEKL